ncbi:MAG TPA: acyltransferase [Ferruginibacter sp.]|nr:acyltransferase [Ferruginibacter sp.]
MAQKNIIPALTGIRAISAYFIFLFHLNFFSSATHEHLYVFLNQFYCFTNFFFVLSGFLIYYRYGDISTLNQTVLHNYFVDRVARIYPILFLLVSATFFTAYYHHYYSTGETIKLYLLNISLLKGFSAKYWFSGIGPSWSLSVEELFYLLAPLIFLYAKNISTLIKTVLIFYGIGLAFTLLFHYFPFENFFDNLLFTSYFTFFGRAFEFACGIFLGMVVKGKIKNNFAGSPGKYSLYAGLLIISASIIFLYLIATYYNIEHATNSWIGMGVNNILLPLGITILFYSLIYHKSLLERFLSSAVMVQLGNATYSFYLLHTSFVLSYIFKFISKNIFIAFICMVIVSYIFHKLIEQPLALIVRKRFHKNYYPVSQA